MNPVCTLASLEPCSSSFQVSTCLEDLCLGQILTQESHHRAVLHASIRDEIRRL